MQGWNILGPAETKPVAEIWDEQLERKKVPTALFGELLNRAIDHRLWSLSRGERAPEFSIELILAMYDRYRADILPKLNTLMSGVDQARQEVEWVEELLEFNESQHRCKAPFTDHEACRTSFNERQVEAVERSGRADIADLIEFRRTELAAAEAAYQKARKESHLYED